MKNFFALLACCLTTCLVCMAPRAPTVPSFNRLRPKHVYGTAPRPL